MNNRMNSKQAAAYLGVAPKTLWEWRNRCPIALPCYRIGKRKVMYLQSDLEDYLSRCRILPISEQEIVSV